MVELGVPEQNRVTSSAKEHQEIEARMTGALAAIEQTVPAEGSIECEKGVRVCMVTPWKQECGNAEYAERLCTALQSFADVCPVDLKNFADEMELRSRAAIRQHFSRILAEIEASKPDVVHIQHEFCFFGKSIKKSNREFARFVDAIKCPIVVTLHTWIEPPAPQQKFRLRNLLKFLRSTDQNRVLYRSLRKCDAIVVHTHDTFSTIASAFPRLRSKMYIGQIPIAPVSSEGVVPAIHKSPGDIWLVLPGFVSKYKGHKHALNALNALPSNYKLIIAGGRHPKDRSATRYWMGLLTDIEKQGLEPRVIFTGFLESGAEQAALLRQADAFLLPYDEVGQSGSAVLADALAHDKPVITSRARSMFAYRMCQDTTYSSVSTDVGSPEKLAHVISQTIEAEKSCGRAKKHRTAAGKRYSLSAVGDVYRSLYANVRRK